MRYLFNDWARVLSRIQRSYSVFLFFDYDGTLTPIVSTPEKAKFPPSIKKAVIKLQKNPRFKIAIISGRSLKNIKKMAGIKGIIYAGNHGLEIEGYRGKILRPSTCSRGALPKEIKAILKKSLKDIKGARVEDKGCTLSVHFRLVNSKERPLVRKIFERIVKSHLLRKKIRVSSGKMVLEVKPGVDWDKGKAVLYLMGKAKRTLPVYIGDDVTDTDGFRAVKRKGISIFVGSSNRTISADYFLNSPKDVERFINKLAG